MRMTILFGLLMLFGNVTLAATDQVGAVSYQVDIRNTRAVSATGLTSSDTPYSESDCIGAMITFTGLCENTRGRQMEKVLVHKVQYFNTGTSTVDATLLIFNRPFTSPGDNAAWALGDGDFNYSFVAKVDLAQSAQVEGGGDTYAVSPDTNILCPCIDANLYGQIVKNKVGPVTTGGDTRSLSADAVMKLSAHQLEPKK